MKYIHIAQGVNPLTDGKADSRGQAVYNSSDTESSPSHDTDG